MSILSTVCCTDGNTIPAGAVSAGNEKYRYDPYISEAARAIMTTTTIYEEEPLYEETPPSAADTMQHGSRLEHGVESTLPINTSVDRLHPLYHILVNGAFPINDLVYACRDCSMFRVTDNMLQNPKTIENYQIHILPKLLDFVSNRTASTFIHDKQLVIYTILSDFFFAMDRMREAVFMLIGKANIYGLRHQNEEAFRLLNGLAIKITESRSRNKRALGSVFIRMVQAVYHICDGKKSIYMSSKYKPILDAHYALCSPYIDLSCVYQTQIAYLNELGYYAQLLNKTIEPSA